VVPGKAFLALNGADIDVVPGKTFPALTGTDIDLWFLTRLSRR
jgi:hypothetical protein